MTNEEYTALRKYLNRVYQSKKNLERKQRAYEQLIKDCGTLPAYDYTQQRVNVSAKSHDSSQTKAIISLTYLETELERERDSLCKLKEHTLKQIKCVGDCLLREVLMYRYYYCMQWADIAKVMSYDLRHVYRLHRLALDKFSEANKREIEGE